MIHRQNYQCYRQIMEMLKTLKNLYLLHKTARFQNMSINFNNINNDTDLYFFNRNIQLFHFLSLQSKIKDQLSLSMDQPTYSVQQLKIQKVQQNIKQTRIHYSIVNKQQRMVSIMGNDRLLIFNETKGELFYTNLQEVNTPFKNQIPNAKNQSANLKISMVSCPQKKSLLVIFPSKKDKNKSQQWKFIFETEDLVKEWYLLLQNYKKKLLSSTQDNKNKNPLTTELNHDIISFGLLPASKQQQTLPIRQTVIKQENLYISREVQKGKKSPQKSFIKEQKNPNQSYIQNKSQVLNKSQIHIDESQKKQIQKLNIINGSLISQVSQKKEDKNIDRSQIKNLNISNDSKMHLSKSNQNINSILKSKAESIKIPDSRYLQESYQVQASQIKTDDWNYKFYQQRSEIIIHQFEKVALRAFIGVLEQDKQKSKQPLRVYEKVQGFFVVSIAKNFTIESKYLKNQFRNYHFLLESNKLTNNIGVPLSCLFEYQGLVCLVKYPFPQNAKQIRFTKQVNSSLKNLQRYTRISNIIFDNKILYDLAQCYNIPQIDNNSNINHSNYKTSLYIDNLKQYLPRNPNKDIGYCNIRPQYILDHVNHFLPGGNFEQNSNSEQKIIIDLERKVQKAVEQLAMILSNQEIIIGSYAEIKDAFHNKGVNLKYLSKVYTLIKNKYTKKYIHTAMVAKIAKDNIIKNLSQIHGIELKKTLQIFIQQTFRLLFEGDNNNSNQYWKQIAIEFKQTYNIIMSIHQIIGGFLLNCMMYLIKAQYNINKFNQQKKIFQQQGIIQKGFVVKLLPKIKSYYRFTTDKTDMLIDIVKDQKNIQYFDKIVAQYALKTKELPQYIIQHHNYEEILSYFSYFICPTSLDYNAELRHLNIYQFINKTPPNSYIFNLIINYLKWCIKRNQNEQFKVKIQQLKDTILYWYDKNHPFNWQLYQCLSDYYTHIGNNNQSINFMKQSLSCCIRRIGVNSKQVGKKYYDLAQKQLIVGRKKDAGQNFMKAKINMENNTHDIKYAVLLMRLSSLYLNGGNFSECIIDALQCIKLLEDLEKQNKNKNIEQNYQILKIDTFQILSRVYQIDSKKNELRDLAITCARRFNQTDIPSVYEKMTRIVLTAAIFRNTSQKSKAFLLLVKRITQNDVVVLQSQRCLSELRVLSQGMIVMEKFMTRYETVDRILAQHQSKRNLSNDTKQILTIIQNVIGCVGENYIEGLVHQKDYE